MKVKNVIDTFLFPVGNLIGDDEKTITRLDKESDEDYKKRSMDLRGRLAQSSAIRHANVKAAADNKPLAPEVDTVESLQAQLNPERVARFKSLGAELPSDLIKVTMSLGSLVFDLFSVTAVTPTPPLAAALFSKRVQNLATALQKDSFELEASLLAQVRPALEDEKLWAKTNLTVYTEVKGQKAYLQVNNNAAGFFPNVVNAAIAVFIPEAVADAAPEAETVTPAPKAVESAPEATAQAN